MEERESSSSEEEDEELNKVLKISAIFSGDDVGKLDAFLPKNCIAETPPPSKGIADTPPPYKAETEVQKRHQNLTTTESHISNEDAALSTSDPVNAVKEDVITVNREEMKEASEKSLVEEQSDDDLEEILADEFIDQDSPDIGISS